VVRRLMVSVTPGYSIHVGPSVLEEKDGPTFEHELKGLHGFIVQLPNRTSSGRIATA